jgi:GTPase SAR1 family protein
MILMFSLLNENGNEIYQKFYVEKSYFSDFQLKTIFNSAPKLLTIVNLTSKIDKSSYSSRIFTITNLLFRIIKFKSIFYLFITQKLFSNEISKDIENSYSNLIKQIDELMILCTSNKPHFDLIQNNYFIQNTDGLLSQFNKYLIKSKEKIMQNIDSRNEKKVNNYYKKTKGKYLIVGTGNAGKSSILAQFLSNWDENELKNIRPTVNKEIHAHKDTLINHNFNLVDLGGQVQYTELHLKDPSIFRDVLTLIYVIDIQDTQKIDFTKAYLIDILKKLKDNGERPYVAIFLHKYDPEIQDNLNQKIKDWVNWIEITIKEFDLDYSYYLTSIKNESARESFARTLLFTLPYWFLATTIKEDLIIRSLNSLAPIFSELSNKKISDSDNIIRNELFNQSILFGFATTKIIIEKWINHLIRGITLVSSEQEKYKEVDIKFDNESAIILMQLKCPLLNNSEYEKVSEYDGVCEITHGIITGLSQFVGLGNVELKQTQIRNKTEFCKFTISI